LGRSTEITRDEVKFQKFIDRLRMKFSQLFLDILKKQLIVKGIITEQDWEEWKNDIVVDYVKDNAFTELKEADLWRERFGLMNEATQFVGEYVSKEWVWKNILRLNDEDIEDMKKQMEEDGPEEDEEMIAPEETPPSNGTQSVDIKVNGEPVKSEIERQKDAEDEKKNKEKQQKKENKYIPSSEDELTEELTRYMAKINEQN
jgi:hypothetical protein